MLEFSGGVGCSMVIENGEDSIGLGDPRAAERLLELMAVADFLICFSVVNSFCDENIACGQPERISQIKVHMMGSTFTNSSSETRRRRSGTVYKPGHKTQKYHRPKGLPPQLPAKTLTPAFRARSPTLSQLTIRLCSYDFHMRTALFILRCSMSKAKTSAACRRSSAGFKKRAFDCHTGLRRSFLRASKNGYRDIRRQQNGFEQRQVKILDFVWRNFFRTSPQY